MFNEVTEKIKPPLPPPKISLPREKYLTLPGFASTGL